MPVFLVMPATLSHHASHPDHKPAISKRNEKTGTDVLQRIGTAIQQEDGGWLVDLLALPVDGRLLIRAPTEHDRLDPTLRGEH
jgi:hypothetical protein